MSSTSDRLAAAIREQYRIDRELGQGGMATVYLAHDLRHDRDVAIKLLHPDLGAALGAERFLAEIKTTARLQHPHILPLLDSGEADGLLFYVMPYIQGETLRARLERERQLPIGDAIRIAREVADALSAAHGVGIIHRDIKPENILLQGGHALVADFGIALAVASAGGARMTQTGLSLGTPQYMSPEQAMGERTIDARSDIYALGAVTYEMLAGEAPFTGPTVQAIIARVMSEDPRSLTRQRKAIPEHVEAAVLHALEKLPADRFSSAAEFSQALDGDTVTRSHGTGRNTMPAREGLRGVAVAVVFCILAAAAAWGWLRHPAASNDLGVVRYRLLVDSMAPVRVWAGQFAISPDGRTIAHTSGFTSGIRIRHRDELGFHTLPATEGAEAPFFSPDGGQIGFYAHNKLQLASLSGGPPVVLEDSVAAIESNSWGTDGYIYESASLNTTAAGQDGIVRVRPTPHARLDVVTQRDSTAGEVFHIFPDPLPNGRGVVFSITFRDGHSAIGAATIGARTHKVLFNGVRAHYARNGSLVYTTNDGKLWTVPFDQDRLEVTGAPVHVADNVPQTLLGPSDFAVSASGTLIYAESEGAAREELIWVSRTGEVTPFDSTWIANFSAPAISPDGKMIAVGVRDGNNSDVWLRRISGGLPTKLTRLNPSNDEPVWLPDGKSVSFISGSSGTLATGVVYRQPIDGSSAVRVYGTGRAISEHAWTPRGDSLVVRTTTPTFGAGDILLAKPGSDTTYTPLVATPASEYSPALSPDGKFLAYTSGESGRYEIYVSPFPNTSSARWQVSSKGGRAPRWSQKTNHLYYVALDGQMIDATVALAPTFSVQSSSVLFNSGSFATTAVSRREWDVMPDDSRFLFVRPYGGVQVGTLVVVEGWAVGRR